jgi:hypothetical protein
LQTHSEALEYLKEVDAFVKAAKERAGIRKSDRVRVVDNRRAAIERIRATSQEEFEWRPQHVPRGGMREAPEIGLGRGRPRPRQ